MRLKQVGVVGATLLVTAVGIYMHSTGVVESNAPNVPVIPISGCREQHTDEVFVQQKYICPGGYQVYTFYSEDARDQWKSVAEYFGTQIYTQGDTWVKADN